jgi:hypothetical protein
MVSSVINDLAMVVNFLAAIGISIYILLIALQLVDSNKLSVG